jgi:SM-20-related protein
MLQSGKFEVVLDGLSDQGFSVVPEFLDSKLVVRLNAEFDELYRKGVFARAKIGKGAAASANNEIRRDEILWFDDQNLGSAQKELWDELMHLKEALNGKLFLGLWDLEGHFALYPPGGFYQRHVDRFSNDDARTVSIVVYLNNQWRPVDGGELAIFPQGQSVKNVEPRAGTLVCFLSDRIEHEVQPAHRQRRSFAGWFRRRKT